MSALTPAGASFPRGNDPDNRNIRLAPTFPELPEVTAAMEAVTTCVRLAAAEKLLLTDQPDQPGATGPEGRLSLCGPARFAHRLRP